MIKYYCDVCGKETKKDGGFRLRKTFPDKKNGAITVSVLVKFSAYYTNKTICQNCGIEKVKQSLNLI